MQSRPPRAPEAREETLDPEDWADAQAVAHRAVDEAIAYLRDIRDRPVWQDMPAQVKHFFETPLPKSPAPLTEVYREVARTVMPYPIGNVQGLRRRLDQRADRRAGLHPRYPAKIKQVL